MRRFVLLASGLSLAMIAGAPIAGVAQEGIELSVFVGGNKPLQDLNGQPAASFKTGFGGGAGVTCILEKNLGLRADVAFAKSDVDVAVAGSLGTALLSQSWSRIMFGGDLVLRFPMGSGVMPYFTTGGGAIRFSESGGRTATRAAGRFGAGLKFPVGDKLGVFAQANSWVYDFNQLKFSYFTKVQVDLMLSAGVSFRF